MTVGVLKNVLVQFQVTESILSILATKNPDVWLTSGVALRHDLATERKSNEQIINM